MSAPRFYVAATTSPDALAEFIKECHTRSATGHPTGNGMVYLLKPTSKGGATIGRVFVPDGTDEIWDEAWVKATKGQS